MIDCEAIGCPDKRLPGKMFCKIHQDEIEQLRRGQHAEEIK